MKYFIIYVITAFFVLSLGSGGAKVFATDKNDTTSLNQFERLDHKLDPDETISKLEYPAQMPDNVPEVKKLFDLTNEMIELFNTNQIKEISPRLQKMMLEEKEAMKRSYERFGVVVEIFYPEDEVSQIKSVHSIVVWGMAAVSGRGVLLIPAFRINVSEGKVASVYSGFPPLSEEYHLLYRFTSEGSQYLTFATFEERPTPWIIWNKEGDIMENEVAVLKASLYDLHTISGGEPRLRIMPLSKPPRESKQE